MYINRDFEKLFVKTLFDRKVLVVYGARQTGKTTLIDNILSNKKILKDGVVKFNGDIKLHREMLSYETMTHEKAASLIGNAKTLFIDEAQKILDIGLSLKIIYDHFKDVKIVATGSSSFELSEEVGEPLTGRMAAYILSPFSYRELAECYGSVSEIGQLPTRIRLGSYPSVVTSSTEIEAVENLTQLCEAYLYKDVLKWQSALP